MDERVLEAGTTWVKLQKEEKCDIIEEVQIMSGNSEWVSHDLVRRNWGVDGNGKPLKRDWLIWEILSSVLYLKDPQWQGGEWTRVVDKTSGQMSCQKANSWPYSHCFNPSDHTQKVHSSQAQLLQIHGFSEGRKMFLPTLRHVRLIDWGIFQFHQPGSQRLALETFSVRYHVFPMPFLRKESISG